MVGESSLARRKHNSHRTRIPAARKRDSDVNKEGACLADLRDDHKAKVARLINQVVLACCEVKRLEGALDQERQSHESLASKLRHQNLEVAADISRLRRQLDSVQSLLAPHQLHKVFLQAGATPSSLTTITEADASGAEENQVNRFCAELSDRDVNVLLSKTEIFSNPFTTAARSSISELAEEQTQNLNGESETADLRPIGLPLEPIGKENKDPEVPRRMAEAESCQLMNPRAMAPKRPPPRPLPKLVTTAADAHYPSLVNLSTGKKGIPADAFTSFNANTEGSHKSRNVEFLTEGAQTSCTYTPHESSRKLMDDAKSTANDFVDSLAGENAQHSASTVLNRRSHSPDSDPLPRSQNKENSQSTDQNYRRHLRRPEVFETEDQQTVCQSSLDESNSTVGRDIMSQKALLKKLRFDPTAGEEGLFYYASDTENHGRAHVRVLPHPTIANDCRFPLKGSSTRETSNRCAKARGLGCDTGGRDWNTKEIEERNSIHRMHDERNSGRQRESHVERGVSASKDNEVVGKGTTVEDDYEHTSDSGTRVCAFRVENLKSLSSRRSSSGNFLKCAKCSTLIQQSTSRHGNRKKGTHERRRKGTRKNEGRKSSFSSGWSSCSSPRCVRCSPLVIPKSHRHSTARSNTPESETNSYSTDEESSHCQSLTVPTTSNFVRCVKCSLEFQNKVPGRRTRRGNGRRDSRMAEVEHRSGPVVINYSRAESSEDLKMSSLSDADNSNNSRSHISPWQRNPRLSQARKVNKDRQTGQVKENSAENQKSEGNSKVHHASHENLNSVSHSGANYTELLRRSSVVNAKDFMPETRALRKHGKHERKASEVRRLEIRSELEPKVSPIKTHSSAPGEPHLADCCQCNRSQPKWREAIHNHRAGDSTYAEQEKQILESKRKFCDVDSLLDTFIRSNAECAAELVKCSIYFESTTQSQAQSKPKTPTENVRKVEETESKVEPIVVPKPQALNFSKKHLSRGEPNSGKSARCFRCQDFLEPKIVRATAPEEAQHDCKNMEEALCFKCSASKTVHKLMQITRSDHGPDMGRQVYGTAHEIYEKRFQEYEPSRSSEAQSPQQPSHQTVSCQIPFQCGASSGDCSSESICDHQRVLNHEQWIPIPLQDPPLKLLDNTTELHQGMFDVSLYHIVNDLEVQRREFWDQINNRTKAKDNANKQHNSRTKSVGAEKGRISAITRGLSLKKHNPAKHFR